MSLIFTFLAGFPPILAALIGTLCAITGPTVINPILRELNIKEEVAETLQGEGELNDAIFGITAAAIFTAFTIETSGILTNLVVILGFTVIDLGIGILIGFGIGGFGIIISKYLRPWITIRYGHRFNHTVIVTANMLGLLCAAVLSYALGKLFGIEAAVASALIAGILLGQRHRFEMISKNSDSIDKGEEEKDLVEAEIHTFQLPLTHIAVATIFIFSITFTLPFLIGIASQVHLIILAIMITILLMFVVRPLAIMIATVRSAFSFREKLFLSFVAPRGVIISALALFFAFSIAILPFEGPSIAALLLWYILVIVFITVLVQGGLASWITRRTGVIIAEPDEDTE
jgi:NhaP-type Na+/H+ or K+/H+ antiporter